MAQEKNEDVSINDEKGKSVHTNILDYHSNAVYLELIYILKGVVPGKNVTVSIVKDRLHAPLYALKSLSFLPTDTEGINQAKEEFKLAQQLGSEHPNIAKGHEIREIPGKVEMLLEYGGKDLSAFDKSPLSNQEIFTILRQTASAMKHVHSKNIFHSDLKPRNILFRDGVAKITDFGVSVGMGKETFLRYTAALTGKMIGGTGSYLPPEVIKHHHGEKERVFTFPKIDVYSWAMVFYCLLVKSPLSSEKMKHCKMNRGEYGEFLGSLKGIQLESGYEKYREGLVKLLSKCLSYEPKERPMFEEIEKDLESLLDPAKKPTAIPTLISPAGTVTEETKASTGFYAATHSVPVSLVPPRVHLQKGYAMPQEIGQLQDVLVRLGYMKEADLLEGGRGIFGPKTEAAVAKYQMDCVKRGIMDPKDLEDGGMGQYGIITRRLMEKDLKALQDK